MRGLAVSDLEVVYRGGIRALQGVSVTVEPGELVAVLGPNGAGKTTLLRAVTGRVTAHGGAVSGGTVTLGGHEVLGWSPSRLVAAGVRHVPAGRSVVSGFSVEENLLLGAHAEYRRRSRNLTRVYERFPALAQRRRTPAGLLSGGQQQMLAVAGALMSEPRYLLLDEPSLGLAGPAVAALRDLLVEINAEGTAVLIVEQHVEMALSITSRAYVLGAGQVVEAGASARVGEGAGLRHSYLGRAATLPDALPGRPLPSGGVVQAGRPVARPAEAVLAVDNVGLRFGSLKALAGVSLSVGAREVVAVVGPNGAGKTSLLNVVSGAQPPQEGSVTFLGRRLDRLPPHAVAAMGLARTFQHAGTFHRLTVAENVLAGRHRLVDYGSLAAIVGRRRVRMDEAAHRQAVDEVLEFLELSSVRERTVGSLPGGWQRRVELGRALASEPRLLLLDEPAAGMSAGEREETAGLIRRVRDDRGVPVVLVEHDLALVMDVADRILVLDFGRPVASGPPATVREEAAVTSAYLGPRSTGREAS